METGNLRETLECLGESVDNSVKLLSAVSNLTAIPLDADSLADAGRKILETLVRELDNIQSCSLLLYEPRQALLKLLSARNRQDLRGEAAGPYNRELCFRPGQGIAGQAFAQNRPCFWEKGSMVGEFVEINSESSTPASLAAMPIRLRDQPQGVLNISFATPAPFDPVRRKHLALLSLIVSNLMQIHLGKREAEQRSLALEERLNHLNQGAPGAATEPVSSPAPPSLQSHIDHLVEELAATRKKLDQANQAHTQTREKLDAALRDRTVLLKEVHHRVRNNMQMVSSLISLHGQKHSAPEAGKAMLDIRNRLHCLTLIHEIIFQSPKLAGLDLRRFMVELLSGLLASYPSVRKRVDVAIDTHGVTLSLEQSVPFGLIVNELVSNAIKHAFPGDRKGRVVLNVEEETPGRIRLELEDDGVGLPETINLDELPAGGLKLAASLATKQLRGSFSLKPERNGAGFTVVFDRFD